MVVWVLGLLSEVRGNEVVVKGLEAFVFKV